MRYQRIKNFNFRLQWLTLITVIICQFSVVAHAQNFKEPWNYSLLNGLPTTEVYELFRDSKGFIWFGSDLGVTRFDGQKFKTFTIADGLASNVVLKCYEDKVGRIWFFHLGANPTYYLNNEIHAIDCKELLSISAKSRFVEMADSTVLLGCFGGVLAVDKQGDAVLHRGNETMHYFTISNYQERLIMFTGKKNIGNKFVRPKPEDYSMPTLGYPVKSVTNQLDSLFDCGVMNYNGLLRSVGFFQDLLYSNRLDIRNQADLFNAFEVKRQGNTLYVSEIDGFKIYRIVNKHLVLQETVIEDVAICSSIFDNQGGLWLGSLSKGLFHYPKVPSSTTKLSGKNTIYTQKLGNSLFIANDEGLVVERTKQKDKVWFDLKGDLQNQFIIKEIQRFNEGHIILSTRGSHVKRGEDAKTIFSTGTCYSCIYLEDLDEMLVSTSEGIMRLQKDMSHRLLDSKITAFRVYNFERHNDVIYAADINGLFKVDLSGIEPAFGGMFSGKRVNVVRNINGLLMVGTEKDGVYIYSNNLWTHITENNGLLTNNTEFIVKSNGNRFWVVGNQGPQLLEFNGGQLIEWGRLDLKTLLRSTDLYQATDFEGKLYLSTLFETFEIEIKDIAPLTPLPLYITEVRTSNGIEQLDEQQSLRLSKDQNNLSIELSAINFSKYATQYFYRINEGEWLTSEDGQINMSSLSPGEYLFEAYAQSNFFKQSKIHSFRFNIQGAFFQSIWFYVLVSILLIVVITFAISRRMNAIHNRKKRLMKMELQALQSQMNPHFTFNTLNSIQNFILKNETRASLDYLSRFAQLMRMILDQSRLQVISIEEEIKFLSIYLSLEQLRMESVFEFEFDIDPEIDTSSLGLPSMLLQPFVENSIWHGFGDIDHQGKLTIQMKRFSDHLECKIIDNGVGRFASTNRKRTERGHKSRGSLISQDRIRIFQELYGEKIQLQISDLNQETKQGTVVSIQLPLMKV